MDSNLRLPPTLALISDAELTRLRRAYEAVQRADSPERFTDGSSRVLREALDAITDELHARGIEDEPWWVAGSPRASSSAGMQHAGPDHARRSARRHGP